MIKPWVMLLSNDTASAGAADAAAAATNSGVGGLQILDLFIIITCVYLLFSGITGKGGLYKDDQIHPSRKADYYKTMRLFALIGGPIGIFAIIAERYINRTFGLIMTGIFVLMIVGLCFLIVPMNTERVEKKLKDKDPRKK